jgi:hypothetical protein
MSTGHLTDLTGDRAEGEHWEDRFCELAAEHRRAWFTRNQKGRAGAAHAEAVRGGVWKRCLLPDVVVWSAPGEHHEVKHKNPHKPPGWLPRYGLEVYRFDALLAFANEIREPVLYTIHDWELAGAQHGRERTPNDIDHWVTAEVSGLAGRRPRPAAGRSWRNGSPWEGPIYYWPTRLWVPLEQYWKEHQPTIWP